MSDDGPITTHRPLPDSAVRRLRELGLWVGITEFEPPLSGTVSRLHGGALIAKPVRVGGNALHEPWPIASGGGDDRTDMPHLNVTPTQEGWDVEPFPSWAPGPGPGRFRKGFANDEGLVAFVLRYFLEPNEHVVAYRRDMLHDHRCDLVARIRRQAERDAPPEENG